MMKIIQIVLFLCLCQHVDAGMLEWLYKEPNIAATLPPILPREQYTSPEEREHATVLVRRGAQMEDIARDGVVDSKVLKEIFQLYHAAAQYGEPAAIGFIIDTCFLGKYGFSREKIPMYRALGEKWFSPAEQEEIVRRSLESTREVRSLTNASDSTRRSSSEAVGSYGTSEEDGSDVAVGQETVGLLSLRHRKPGAAGSN